MLCVLVLLWWLACHPLGVGRVCTVGWRWCCGQCGLRSVWCCVCLRKCEQDSACSFGSFWSDTGQLLIVCKNGRIDTVGSFHTAGRLLPFAGCCRAWGDGLCRERERERERDGGLSIWLALKLERLCS